MKILLAIDGSAQSEAAIAMLRSFSFKPGDEIRIISVVDMAVPLAIDIYGGYLPDTTEMEKTAREHADKVLRETCEKLEGICKDLSVASDVLFGSPESRIVETAEEMGTDLIIVGSHGYSRWERLLLGSVSQSVVQHAHCSVLVVRAKQAE
ncbi:MAG: universal stress protein [Acidobacteria bacterium]|nr:universal stress protein [Acidobacteriota bacterium]